MDEYPDPEEEYEMLHLEEMEALIDMEKEMLMAHQGSRPKKSKNSLNFDDLDLSYENEKRNILEEDTSKNSSVSHDIRSSRLKKRILSTGSLMDMTSDLDVIEHQPKKFRYDISVNQTSEYELNNEFGTTSFRVPKWPFITISTNLGDRLYVKLRDNQEDDEMSAYCKSQSTRNNLLETPYSTLRSLVEESFKSRLINEEIEKLPLDGQGEIQDHSGLWVEKFKPQTYFDLLSDEAVNRTLLNWLKMWDKIVFNKELSEKILIKSNLNKENDFKIDVNKLDADGRPHYKIALLCGPPGLGKTTLAHIAVHMAGYNAIEMNASDDRSIESLKTKLDNATQMQAVMGACKPSCLILDEIDGAPIQTVDFLLKYINSKINEKTKNQKKDKPIKILKRPIICICNELYTPSLRQLRQQAFVIHFPNTSSTKLAQRLMEICRKQDIKTDVSALTLLCDKAQNDIRSCISTLHFFKKQSGQRFKSADVLNSSMGLKDMQKSAFSIWKEIFQNPMKRLGIFSKALNKATEDEVSSHVNYSKKGMYVFIVYVDPCIFILYCIFLSN